MTAMTITPHGSAPPAGAGFSILVADDDPKTLDLLRRLLTAQGHRVRTARDGNEAWDLFQAHEPDIVVCDIRMPGPDGVELLRRVREVSTLTEVVLITGFADTGLVIEALRAGASNLVEKPFHLEDFLRQLETSFLRRGLLREKQQLQEALEAERRQRELCARMVTLGRLMAGLAHEIHNPLTFLKGNAELVGLQLARLRDQIAGGTAPEAAATLEEMSTLLGDVGSGARRIQELIDSMKRLGAPSQEPSPLVRVNELMERSLKFAQPRLPAHARVDVGLPADDLFVRADPLDFESCLVNLLVNAFEAVQQAGSTVHFRAEPISFETPAFQGLLEIAVDDDGPGLPPGGEEDVFTPFFTRKEGGTGLGLTIAYEAARKNGGLIEVRPLPEGGTRAVLRIPYLRQTQPAAGDLSACCGP